MKKERAKQIYIVKCLKGHRYERKDNDLIEYINKCPECGTYMTGIVGARWLKWWIDKR